MAVRSEKLNLIMNSLEDTIQLAVEYNFPDEDIFKECKEIAFKLLKCEAESKQSLKAIDDAKKDDTVEVFKSTFNENKMPITDNSIKQSSRYKAFETQIAHLTENVQSFDTLNESMGVLDTEEIDLDQSSSENTIKTTQIINDIDPITKQQLEKPCRNRICNHIYGMNTIIQMLQTKPNLKCVILGCGNKKAIQINDLVPDEDLERRLKLQRNKLKSK